MRPLAARAHARRTAVLACGFATALGLVLAPPAATAAPEPPPVPDSAPDEASASRAARAGDKQVRVDGLTDETTEVLANPDGTFTMTQHVRPVRVKRDGAWTPVDTTLVERPDGTVGPRAAAVDIAISGGGRGPLATVEQDGSEVGLVWLAALPRPVLEGPTATYREVMTGVDLKVTADVEGFSQVLVVKDRAAAEALGSVAFGTHAKNAKVEAHRGNGAGRDSDLPADQQEPADALKVKDPAGETVFIGDASRMWDSAGEATPQERLDGAGTGANTAAMDATVTPKGVTIEPDAEFLADPDTVYPVYLDPSYTCTSPNCGKAHHAVVQSEYPDAQNYNRTDGKLNDLKAGYACDGPCFVSRTYLGMKTASLDKKIIHSADLHLEVIHSAECANATPTELWRSNSITSTFTWNTQQNWGPGSGWGAKLSTGNVKNNATYCPGASGMDLDATAAIVDAAAGGWDVTTFMLKGSSESNQTSWRRFGLNPYLVVKYNSKPNAPTDLGINGWGSAANQALPCTTGAARSFVNTRTPRLRARVSDPDGGTLSAGFRVFVGPHNNYTGPVVDTVDSSTASGLFAEITVPSGRITADGVHTWHLWSSDGDVSSWSPNCELHVDTIAPATPVVTSEKYPTGRPAGGVGVASTFTFAPPTADPQKDIDYYLYGFTNQGGVPATKVNPTTLNAPATVSWTPSDSGLQVLTVKSVDRAGNVSPTVEYRFEVSDYKVGTSGKVAHWSFEDDLADTAGSKSLRYTGPYPEAYYDIGANDSGRAVHLVADSAETGEHYQTPDALVRSDRPFTVSAWANLAATNHDHSVLSHDGDRASVVDLRYSAADNAWAAVVTSADTDAPVTTKITAPAVPGQWTHLAVVYDPNAGNKLSLYVGGAFAAEAVLPGGLWNATGPFVVGTAKAAGARTNHFTGAVDTVRVHDRALNATEVAGLHSGTSAAAPVAEYLFEDNLLNSGANHDLTWTETAVHGTGYAAKSITLDRAVAARPKTGAAVINTAADFSVTAWVKLKDKERHYGVVSQDGVRRAGFLVRYAPDVDRWIFGLVDRDADDGVYQWAIGTSVPAAGVWTHIAAVHDATNNKIRLYVNGVLEAERDQVPPTFSATGGFAVGNYRALGSGSGHFNGDLDEIAVYDGVLTAAEVADVMNAPVERARYRLSTDGSDDRGGPAATVHGTGVQWGTAGGQQAATFAGHHMEGPGVAGGAGPKARWSFDSTLTDASGNGKHLDHRNATATTTPTYGGPWVGTHAVQLNGTDQRLQLTGPLVTTTASFSVSAWVKLDRTNSTFTVAAQDGAQTSPFVLRYSGRLQRWVFAVMSSDVANTTVTEALSDLPAKAGGWTHLVAVYDATSRQARLHVDGELDDSVAAPALWQSSGPFVLGRFKWNGGQYEFFPGALDEVKVYDRALTGDDVHRLWNLGSNIYAQQPAQFRSDQSFTLAAWVRPSQYDGTARKAISLGGFGRFSAVSVGWRPEWNRWGVLAETTGGADADYNWILSDNEAASYGTGYDGWVHLAVAYNAPAQKILFYVNGIPQTTAPIDGTTSQKVNEASPPVWYAGANLRLPNLGDELLVGRATWNGLAAHNWSGAIRDVRAFSGVLPEACDRTPVCVSQLMVQ